MVSLAGVLLDHVPPVGVLLCKIVRPIHDCNEPVMGVGPGFTVTIDVLKHPVGNV
jgi:hypothetical protein